MKTLVPVLALLTFVMIVFYIVSFDNGDILSSEENHEEDGKEENNIFDFRGNGEIPSTSGNASHTFPLDYFPLDYIHPDALIYPVELKPGKTKIPLNISFPFPERNTTSVLFNMSFSMQPHRHIKLFHKDRVLSKPVHLHNIRLDDLNRVLPLFIFELEYFPVMGTYIYTNMSMSMEDGDTVRQLQLPIGFGTKPLFRVGNPKERAIVGLKGLKRGPSMGPDTGYQDPGYTGVGENIIISVAGFCGGCPWKEKGIYSVACYGCLPRGFLNRAILLNTKHSEWGWQQLPDIPGHKRQLMTCVSMRDVHVFCFGGISYEPADTSKATQLGKFKKSPYGYSDMYYIHIPEKYQSQPVDDELQWVPRAFCPVALAGATAATHLDNIYVIGQGDYDYETYHTWSDRDGGILRYSSRLWIYNVENDTWNQGPACPGTPRFLAMSGNIDDEIYYLGGMTGTGHTPYFHAETGFAAAVDNWVYKVSEGKWYRLKDSPASIMLMKGGSSIYRNRFIVMAAGSIRTRVQRMDGEMRMQFGRPQSLMNQRWQNQLLSNELIVYDSVTNEFQSLDTVLPFDVANPGIVVLADRMFMFGGESPRHCWNDKIVGIHFDDCLVGDLETWVPLE